MTVRHRLAVAAALLLLAPASVAAQQRGGRITVAFQGEKFSRVVGAFAAFSGRTIIVARDVGNPDVTAAVQDTDWQLALNGIVRQLDLHAGVDDAGIIIISKAKSPQTGPRLTIGFQDQPLRDVVSSFAAFAGRDIVLPPDLGNPPVTVALENIDWQLALEAILQQHGLVARADAAGVLRVERRAPAPR